MSWSGLRNAVPLLGVEAAGDVTMDPLQVRQVVEADADKVVATITLAFATDPAARWSLPDPEAYLTHFPTIVRAFGGRAFEHGTAHEVDGFGGAALWLPPGVGPDEEALGAFLEEGVSASLRDEVDAVLEQMDERHPREPHWFLPLIGVDPSRQGAGIGNALMTHALERCDADGLPAYLESSNPANVPFYERHGFEVAGLIQAGSSPPIRPMYRKPR